MMSTHSIVLIDDHVIVRNGLKELIEKLGPYKVSHQFESGRELLAQIPFQDAISLFVLDLNLGDMNGEEVVQQLNEKKCNIPILVLTLNSDEAAIVRLFRNGIRGYLQKNCSAQELNTAISEILRCGYYHNDFLNMSLRKQQEPDRKTERDKILEALTPREREFLKWVCHENEFTYEQIADKMGVQHRTVDGYRQEVFEKFGIKSKTGLVLFVLKHQLLQSL